MRRTITLATALLTLAMLGAAPAALADPARLRKAVTLKNIRKLAGGGAAGRHRPRTASVPDGRTRLRQMGRV
jgi:hypothetical protein